MFLRLNHDSRTRLFLLLALGLEGSVSLLEVVQQLRSDEDLVLARWAPEFEKRLVTAKGVSQTPLGTAMEKMGRAFTPFQIHRVKKAEASSRGLPGVLRELAQGEEENFRWSLSYASKVRFFRELSMALAAGVSYARILQIMSQDHEKDLSQVARALERRVTLDGRPVSVAMGVMKRIFSPFQIAMVAVGENGGGLPKVFRALEEEEERREVLRKQLQVALIVPTFVLAFLVLFMLVGFPLFGVGAYLELIQGVDLSEDGLFGWLIWAMQWTQTPVWWGGLMGLAVLSLVVFRSESLREQFLLSVLSLLARLPGSPKSLRTFSAKRQGWEGLLAWGEAILPCIPIVGPVLWRMWVSLLSCRFAYALGIQLDAGVALENALGMALKVTGSPRWSGSRRQVVEALKAGDLVQAFDEIPGCPHMLVSMVEVGAEVGSLPFLCEKTAQIFREEFDHRLDVATRLLEPMIVLVMGFGVVIFIVVMLWPMMRLMNSL